MDGKLGFYNPTQDYLNVSYLNLDLSYKQLQVQTICTILNKLLVNLELKPAVMVPKKTTSQTAAHAATAPPMNRERGERHVIKT